MTSLLDKEQQDEAITHFHIFHRFLYMFFHETKNKEQINRDLKF